MHVSIAGPVCLQSQAFSSTQLCAATCQVLLAKMLQQAVPFSSNLEQYPHLRAKAPSPLRCTFPLADFALQKAEESVICFQTAETGCNTANCVVQSALSKILRHGK